MKIGMCMFLWTTAVGSKHEALLRDIKATGFDGVEIPIFSGAPTTIGGWGPCSTGSAWNGPPFPPWATRR